MFILSLVSYYGLRRDGVAVYIQAIWLHWICLGYCLLLVVSIAVFTNTIVLWWSWGFFAGGHLNGVALGLHGVAGPLFMRFIIYSALGMVRLVGISDA